MVMTAQNTKQIPWYKQTEVGVIPEDWEVKKLGDVADFLDGRRRPINERDRAKMLGEYPYYGASGVVDYVNDYIFDEELILLGEDGENILSRNCKLAFQVCGKIWVNNHAHVLRPKANTDLSFLTEYLESLDYKQYNTGTAQPKLNKRVCLGIIVFLPSLPEQRAIATALSDVDAMIMSLDRLIAKKRDIKQAAMQQLLTGKMRLPGFSGEWEVKKLGEIAYVTKLAGFEYTNYFNGYKDGGDIVVIRGTNITNNKLDLSDVRTIPIETSNKLQRSKLKRNDLVFAYVGTIGPVYLIEENDKYHLGPNISKITIGNETSPRYLYHYFTSPLIENEIIEHTSIGAQPSLSMSKIRKFTVFVPPTKSEQTSIATVISDMDAEIAALEQKRDKTLVLKQGMMQELLTGKTRLI